MIKLSIIIPCYNCEKYVYDTVKSINDNCYQDSTEIILINDGSKDHTLEVLNKISTEYANVRIIDKINEGVSVARNTGLSVAKGEYVGFVDSDDIIINDMFKKMIDVSADNNSDIVTCSFLEEVDGKKYFSRYKYNNSISTKDEAIKKFFSNNVSIAVWDKIYRKSILKDIKFNKNLAVGEDTLFCYDAINAIKTNLFELDLYGYIYIQRSGSAVHNVNEKIIGVYDVHKYIKFDNKYKEDFNFFKAYSMMRCINTYSYLYKNDREKVYNLISKVYDKDELRLLINNDKSNSSLKLESFVLLHFGIKFHLFIFGVYDFMKKIKRKEYN